MFSAAARIVAATPMTATSAIYSKARDQRERVANKLGSYL
jgi:hypothetical protein